MIKEVRSVWRSHAHLVLSPGASTISAAGSPACGGTLPRHLLWHRPVNGTWSRLGPWCRSSLDRRWPTSRSLCIPLLLFTVFGCNFDASFGGSPVGQRRGKDGGPLCPQCPAASSEEATLGFKTPNCSFRKQVSTDNRWANLCAGKVSFSRFGKNPGLSASAATAVVD